MQLGRSTIGRALLIGAAVLAIATGLLWSQRRPIAAGVIDRALAARGVQASYDVREIGVRTHRLENLRLGDPAKPDLTAEWAEVVLVPTWRGVRVTAIDARGVRLRGRLVAGRVSWGAVDKLLPAPTGKPFALPDIDLRLADARVMLATDMGDFDIELSGGGGLTNGFTGLARATARTAGRGCQLQAPVLAARIAITNHRPHIVGALRSRPSTCGGIAYGSVRSRFDVTLGRSFDSWSGKAEISASGVRRDAIRLAEPTARLTFSGTANQTSGNFAMSSPAARYDSTRLAGLAATGRFALGAATNANGSLRIERAIADPVQIASLRRALGSAGGTPVGPLAAVLSQTVERAAQAASVEARFAYRDAAVRLSEVQIASKGGGLLTVRNGDVVVDRGGVAADADLALSGGGFPTARGRLRRAGDGTTRGSVQIAPYRAGNAQAVLSPLRFAARRDGALRVQTTAILDGPLADGRAEGVNMPIVVERASAGDIRFAPGCTPISFRRIAIAGTVLAPARFTLCPTRGGAIVRSDRSGVGGGAQTGPLRLTGKVGEQPLVLSAAGASFDLDGPVRLSAFSALLGGVERSSRIRIERVAGVARGSGLSGNFSGLAGNIARVPLVVTAGQGTWSLAGGTLDVGGAMTMADEATVARFNPLAVQGMKLRLKDGQIAANATLVEPVSKRTVTRVAVDHDLGNGSGEARLNVDALTFSKSLQPEAITPLTEGVVADVYGQIDGSGIVRWQGDRLTSSGIFRTDGLDFAAAFGPVTGASGVIEFDDLIALSTPPGQQVKLVLVNPGVEVKDGVITYRLRPNQVVEIERGRWPFAGGELLLDAGTIDLGQLKPRTLSFRVVALDAAKFIEQLKLENIAVTGTFDGTLPIVFDASGGQIVGGQIVARSGGGTLAYVGDVSNADTNTLAKLAFDALKSIRYGHLAIGLDGSLDGEIISLVRFDGVNQSPVAPSGLAKSFTGLPFKFNIRVRAPFRGLVNTARSYQDPGLLLNRTVQPAASDARP